MSLSMMRRAVASQIFIPLLYITHKLGLGFLLPNTPEIEDNIQTYRHPNRGETPRTPLYNTNTHITPLHDTDTHIIPSYNTLDDSSKSQEERRLGRGETLGPH